MGAIDFPPTASKMEEIWSWVSLQLPEAPHFASASLFRLQSCSFCGPYLDIASHFTSDWSPCLIVTCLTCVKDSQYSGVCWTNGAASCQSCVSSPHVKGRQWLCSWAGLWVSQRGCVRTSVPKTHCDMLQTGWLRSWKSTLVKLLEASRLLFVFLFFLDFDLLMWFGWNSFGRLADNLTLYIHWGILVSTGPNGGWGALKALRALGLDAVWYLSWSEAVDDSRFTRCSQYIHFCIVFCYFCLGDPLNKTSESSNHDVTMFDYPRTPLLLVLNLLGFESSCHSAEFIEFTLTLSPWICKVEPYSRDLALLLSVASSAEGI